MSRSNEVTLRTSINIPRERQAPLSRPRNRETERSLPTIERIRHFGNVVVEIHSTKLKVKIKSAG